MIFYINGNKVNSYYYYGGDSSIHVLKIYERRKFLFFSYWKKIHYQYGFASPSNSEKHKMLVEDYFGESYTFLIEKSKKIYERKNKIKMLLK
jgi:hypothetical protein